MKKHCTILLLFIVFLLLLLSPPSFSSPSSSFSSYFFIAFFFFLLLLFRRLLLFSFPPLSSDDQKRHHATSLALILSASGMNVVHSAPLLHERSFKKESETKNKKSAVLYFSVMSTFSLLSSGDYMNCLLYTSPSPRDVHKSRMPSSA